MYESPIEKVCSDIINQIINQDEENLLYQVNQVVGYRIDKDELLKALQYDRQQYAKGYEAGRTDLFTTEEIEILLHSLCRYFNWGVGAPEVVRSAYEKLQILKGDLYGFNT